MQYTKVTTPAREALIAVKPTNWVAPYQKLFDQTDASGYEVWLAESHDNFNNPFQKTSEQCYDKRGYWAEIFRDVVREGGKGTDDKGRLNLTYLSHANTEWQKEHDVWAPKEGWYVPTEDGTFVPYTLIPFETVNDKREALKLLKKHGIPKKYASYFHRLDEYDSDRFVGRGFLPGWGGTGLSGGSRPVGRGRFLVDASRLPSHSGDGRVASRPAYGQPEIIMDISEPHTVNA